MIASRLLIKNRVQRNILVTVVFLIGSYLITSQYLWNPDPHHDGIMFTAAIAFVDGLRPNIDYFAQYGPLASVIQGFGLLLFGKTLMGLRLLTSFLLILTGLLVSRRIFQIYGLGLGLVFWISLAVAGPMGLPWSTVITTNLIVIVLFTSFEVTDHEIHLRPTMLLLGTQIILVGSLVRIQLIVIFFALTVVFIINRKFMEKNFLKKFIYCSFFTTTLSVVILTKLEILPSYIKQSFLWAFNYYATPSITLTYISGLIWFFIIPLVCYFMYILVYKSFKFKHKIGYVFLPIIISGLFKVLSTAYALEETGKQSLFNPSYFFYETLKRSLLSIDYLPISLFVGTTFYLHFLTKRREVNNALNDHVLLAFGIGTLTQLYPLFDPWHLWMISPIFVMILSLGRYLRFIPKVHKTTVVIIFGIFTSVSTLGYIKNSSSQSFEFDSKILKGMTSSRADARQLDSTLLHLQKEYPGVGQVKFLCTDGLYAAAIQRYMNEDYMFVDWGLESTKIEAMTKSVFVCDYTKMQIDGFRGNGWNVVFEMPSGHLNHRRDQLNNALLKRD